MDHEEFFPNHGINFFPLREPRLYPGAGSLGAGIMKRGPFLANLDHMNFWIDQKCALLFSSWLVPAVLAIDLKQILHRMFHCLINRSQWASFKMDNIVIKCLDVTKNRLLFIWIFIPLPASIRHLAIEDASTMAYPDARRKQSSPTKEAYS